MTMTRTRRSDPEAGAAPIGAAENPTRVLVVLLAAGAAFALSQTLVLPALPALALRYGVDTSVAAWVLTGFLLSASVATAVVGKLGDRFGKGRVLTWVLVIFSIGGAVNALAPDIRVLIAGRVLQGVAGGVFPLAFGIVRDSFPRARVPGAISTISAVFGVGAGVGLPLSGVIVDQLDLSWLFWLSLVALPAAAAAQRWIPRSPPGDTQPVDWAGALLLAAALSSLLLGVTQASTWGWGSAFTVGLLALGVVLLLVWVRVEARHAAPLIRLDVLAQPTVAATNLTAFLVGLAMFSGFLLVPQLAQSPVGNGYGLGASATVAGLLLLPSAVGQLLFGSIAGRLGAAVGFRATLVLGTALMAVALTVLTVVHSRQWHLVLGGFVLGTGIAFAFGSMANLVVDAVHQAEVGVATGINNVLRTVGGAFGTAVSTAVLAGTALPDGSPSGGGYTLAFVLSATTAVVATAIALLVPRRPVPPAAPTSTEATVLVDGARRR